MKIHRFISNFNLGKTEVDISDTEIVNQVKNVLKLEPGETIILSDGKGTEAEVVIETIGKKSISGAIVSKRAVEENGKIVSLYLAILKKENFELAVQKATECGVGRIIPIITERTVKTGLNIDRLKKIAKEASEQSGRNTVPEIYEILKFSDVLKLGKDSDQKIIFHLGDNKYQPKKESKSVSIFIGPEGGFTEKEIAQAKDAGYTVASLGPLTLRGETAAIIATYSAVQGI